MAKVFDTEVLYVNDKNIQITATGDGKFDFLDSNNNVVFSKTGYDQSITSLSDDIYEKDVIVKSESITAAASTKEVIFNTANFTAQPSVVGLMSSSAANDPVIDSQLLEVTASSAKFALSDDLPSSDYKINLLIKGSRSQSLWTPASLGSDLEMWYDFSDSDVITESGGVVSRVDDKSDNSLELTVPDGSTGPSTTPTTINDINVLNFDGDILINEIETSEQLTQSTNNVLYVTSLMQLSSIGYQFFWALRDTTTGSRLSMRTLENSSMIYFHSAGSFTPPLFSVNVPFFTTFKMAETSSQGFLNGSSFDDVFTITQTTLNQIVIGGNEVYSATSIDALYGDFMIYRGDDTTRQKVEGYLAHKWGLANKLPSSHSYKTNRPS
jgi:hypothetical protein